MGVLRKSAFPCRFIGVEVYVDTSSYGFNAFNVHEQYNETNVFIRIIRAYNSKL